MIFFPSACSISFTMRLVFLHFVGSVVFWVRFISLIWRLVVLPPLLHMSGKCPTLPIRFNNFHIVLLYFIISFKIPSGLLAFLSISASSPSELFLMLSPLLLYIPSSPSFLSRSYVPCPPPPPTPPICLLSLSTVVLSWRTCRPSNGATLQ